MGERIAHVLPGISSLTSFMFPISTYQPWLLAVLFLIELNLSPIMSNKMKQIVRMFYYTKSVHKYTSLKELLTSVPSSSTIFIVLKLLVKLLNK